MKAANTTVLAITIWSYVQSWIARCIGLLIFLVLAHLLRPQDFGTFAIAALMLALAETVLDQGLATALIQREQLHPEHLNAAFWGALAMGAALALGAACVAWPLADWFDTPAIALLMLALAPALLLMAGTLVPAARLRRELNYRGLTRRALWANLLAGFAAIAVAARGGGAWAFVANQWVYQLVSLAVLWPAERWRPAWHFSPSCLRELFSFSNRVSAAKLLDFAEVRALEFWVAQGLGLGTLGQYHFASRNAQAGQQLVAGPVWDSSLGILSRLQTQNGLLKDNLLRLLTVSAWMAFPPLSFVIVMAPIAVPLVFGEKWSTSVWCLQLLLVLALLRAPLFLLGVAMQARGFAKTALHLTLVRVLCVLLAALALAPRDIAMAAQVLLAAQGLGALFVLAAARRQLAVGPWEIGRALAWPLLFCAVGAASVLAALEQLHGRGWPLLLSLGAVYLAGWGLLAIPAARRLRGPPLATALKL